MITTTCQRWRARRDSYRPAGAPPRGVDKGRTMAEVNRERRARGELGTKRQRKARRR